jgi:hypothetical protein
MPPAAYAWKLGCPTILQRVQQQLTGKPGDVSGAADCDLAAVPWQPVSELREREREREREHCPDCHTGVYASCHAVIFTT